MNDRLISLAGALLAVIVLLVLFGPRGGEPEAAPPTSIEKGPDGLSGLRAWLEGAGIPVRSLRRRYPTLALEAGLPDSGNLLITLLPQRTLARPAERAELVRWVEQGNAVLVLAAMADWPDWAQREADRATLGFISAFGLQPAPPGSGKKGEQTRKDDQADEEEGEEADQKAQAPRRPDLATLLDKQEEALRLLPAGSHPALAGVSGVAAVWRHSEGHHWRLSGVGHPRAVLPLLMEGPGDYAFWQARVGAGTLWLSRHAALFANGTIGREDNARFAANLVGLSLGPGGAVLFDDYHQGLSELYDPKAFFGDPRLTRTLAFLSALWLIYLLGTTSQLRPRRPRAARISLADEVRALGGLLARRVTRAAAARRLFEHFFNELRSRNGLPRNGRPAWALLEQDPRVPGGELAAARALHAAALEGRAVDLMVLQDSLHRLRSTQR